LGPDVRLGIVSGICSNGAAHAHSAGRGHRRTQADGLPARAQALGRQDAFLAQAGFVLRNREALLTALRRLAESFDAVEDRADEYGTFYRTEGTLEGPAGALQVICIWLEPRVGGKIRFVTLKPARRRTADVPSVV
jgi:hypothetical protein